MRLINHNKFAKCTGRLLCVLVFVVAQIFLPFLSAVPAEASEPVPGAEITVEQGPVTIPDKKSQPMKSLDKNGITVFGTQPTDGETGVALNTNIYVTFNQNVQQGSNFGQIALLKVNPNPSIIDIDTLSETISNQNALKSGDLYEAVACQKYIQSDKLIINPNTDLSNNATYIVRIPAGAVKDTGGNINSLYTFSFSTPDTIPPHVIWTVPADRATNVPADQIITIAFNENVFANNLNNITLKKAITTSYGGASVSVPCGKSISGNKLIITPVTDLDTYPNALHYEVWIGPGAVKDAAGNVMNVGCDFSFMTGTSPSYLYVASTDPSNNSIDVPVDKTITVTFSQDVMPGTNYNGIVIKDVGGNVVEATKTLSTMPNHRFLFINPQDNLKFGTTYIVTIPAGAVYLFDMGSSGPSLPNDYTFKFTTRSFDWPYSSPKAGAAPAPDSGPAEKTQFDVILKSPGGSKLQFVDMQNHWAAESVSRLVYMCVIGGYEDGTFRPDNEITRAEIASLLARLLQLQQSDSSSADKTKGEGAVGKSAAQDSKKALDAFITATTKASYIDAGDIPSWAQDAVATVTELGVMSGYPESGGTVFKPGNPVTRLEMAVVLSRMIGSVENTDANQIAKFKDASEIPTWALSAVNSAVAAGIVSGYPDGTFKAEKNVLRAEAAAMVVRCLDYVASIKGKPQGVKRDKGDASKVGDKYMGQTAHF